MVTTGTDTKSVTSFQEWTDATRGWLAEARPAGEQLTGVQRIMESLLAVRDRLDLSRFTPGKTSYARHLIHRDPQDRFCLLVLVWKPGQGTPIHDHAGTWGVYGVLRNRMRFTNYAFDRGDSRERLVMIQSTLAATGSTTTVLPPHCDIHRMENPDRDQISMTLHCYGKELVEFNVFTPESGAKRSNTVGYDTTP